MGGGEGVNEESWLHRRGVIYKIGWIFLEFVDVVAILCDN